MAWFRFHYWMGLAWIALDFIIGLLERIGIGFAILHSDWIWIGLAWISVWLGLVWIWVFVGICLGELGVI